MVDERTIPTRSMVGVPVRTLDVAVVSGPDQGAAFRSEGEPVAVGTAEGNALVLRDRAASRFHLELRPAGDRVRVTDLGSTNGTRIGTVLLENGAVSVPVGTELGLGSTVLLLRGAEASIVQIERRPSFAELRGSSTAMQRLFAQLDALAAKPVSVLLLGESGTGKELAARALHARGARPDGPFVTLDCGAIAPTLFQSELFGHERGAFTGADRQHKGAFERAHGGTLFLDEVGELPIGEQASLLGALERRRIRRVGGHGEIAVDVRVVAATHRDLRRMVNEQTFRMDLYYRLAIVLVQLPPLRDRGADIPALIEHFLHAEGIETPLETLFPPAKMRELAAYPWPGNVRELRNVVLASVAVGDAVLSGAFADPSTAQPLGEAGSLPSPTEELMALPYREARDAWIARFETPYLTRLLERGGGSVRQAARLARMDRGYLADLLRKNGVGGKGG